MARYRKRGFSKYAGTKKVNRYKRSVQKGLETLKNADPEYFRKVFGYSKTQMPLAGYQAQNDFQKGMRRNMRYSGEGDYWDNLKAMIPKGTFSNIGRGLGMASNIPFLGDAGAWAGDHASKFFGFGDYGPTQSNQLVGGGSGATVNASSDLTGDIYYSHREFVGNVIASATAAGSSTLQQTVFQLNPGLSATFPFLSQLASNFELYDFQGLMFEYKPTSGENATANSLGKIIMATQYDPDADPFLNSVQIQNYDYAASCKPSVPMIHGVETANSQQAVNMMYIRTGNSSKDRVFTDLGKFVVATEGIPFSTAGTQILGELWVTYRVKLSRANLYNSLLGLSQPLDYYTCNSSTAEIWPQAFATTRAANSGIWSISSGTGLVKRDIKFTAPASLIAGCYQWTILCHEQISATTLLQPSILTGANLVNCAPVQQRQFIAQQGDLIWSPKIATEILFMTSGFISVNNSNGTAPTFTVRMTSDFSLGFFITVSISQVPCTVMTNALL